MSDLFERSICTDCGSTPIWWYARRYEDGFSYCRFCFDKNGHFNAYALDPDLLVEWLRRRSPIAGSSHFEELAWSLLQECAR